MIQKDNIYLLKEEFFKELQISLNQYDKRKADLLEWLSNFYDFEILPGRPIRIFIKEVYGEYQPLPRHNQISKQDKMQQYEQFTVDALGTTYKPNSKTRIARQAIDNFGFEKYGHTSQRAVANRYITPAFNKHGETNDHSIWVYYSTYEPLPEDVVKCWRDILKASKISEQEAANAFYRYAEGEDISVEIGYYKNALDIFKEKYKDVPILVKEWKCADVGVTSPR